MYSRVKSKRLVKVFEGVVGVDIGKYQHVAVAQRWDGNRMKPLVFENNQDGFDRLYAYISESQNRLGTQEMRVAFEPTGHYWKALAEWLNRTGLNLEMVQPAHTHKAKELEDNSPGKTDFKDAGVIADLALQGKSRKFIIPGGVFAELRYLTHFRQQLVIDLNRHINQLHQVMDHLFPELFSLFNHHIGKGLLNLLQQAAVPEKVLALGQAGIAGLLKRGRTGAKRAEAIMEVARKSVGVRHGKLSLEMKLKHLLEQLELINRQLEQIEKQIKTCLQQIPYTNVLLSIPYLGEITLAILLGEMGDLKHYHSAEQIIKLAGLNLYEISSGQQHGKKRISKRGRPLLRQMLYLSCLRMIQAKGRFYMFYQRLVNKGRPKTVAVVAMTCKLLRVMFALVRDNKLFNEEQVGKELTSLQVA